jgi:hypothetical protein
VFRKFFKFYDSNQNKGHLPFRTFIWRLIISSFQRVVSGWFFVGIPNLYIFFRWTFSRLILRILEVMKCLWLYKSKFICFKKFWTKFRCRKLKENFVFAFLSKLSIYRKTIYQTNVCRKKLNLRRFFFWKTVWERFWMFIFFTGGSKCRYTYFSNFFDVNIF